MAPFKLKFRMGNSRSTSQEQDPDQQVNEALLDGTSSSTIDSTDNTSMSVLIANDRKSLLPNKINNLNSGYICKTKTDTATPNLPTTPPPSYEHVLEEDTRINKIEVSSKKDQLPDNKYSNYSYQSSIINFPNGIDSITLKEYYLDQDYQENIAKNDYESDQTNVLVEVNETNQDIDYRKESIDSTAYLISEKMTTPFNSQQDFLNSCPLDCSEYTGIDNNNKNENTSNFCDPLNGCNGCGCCTDENHYGEDCDEQIENNSQFSFNEEQNSIDSETLWNKNQMSSSRQTELDSSFTPEILSNKSSKEIYKDLAKQWGIACKMSDGCRCMECQSHYFDCEFDEQNEHQKIDGGLGAGMPMFIGDVIHGSACTIL